MVANWHPTGATLAEDRSGTLSLKPAQGYQRFLFCNAWSKNIALHQHACFAYCQGLKPVNFCLFGSFTLISSETSPTKTTKCLEVWKDFDFVIRWIVDISPWYNRNGWMGVKKPMWMWEWVYCNGWMNVYWINAPQWCAWRKEDFFNIDLPTFFLLFIFLFLILFFFFLWTGRPGVSIMWLGGTWRLCYSFSPMCGSTLTCLSSTAPRFAFVVEKGVKHQKLIN